MRVPPNWPFGVLVDVGNLYNTYIAPLLNGQISFGDGVDPDNLKGIWVSVTSPVTPDTEFAVAHNQKLTPTGFLDTGTKDKAGVFYQSGTTWTDTTIYLKCSVASCTAKLFLLLPPQ